MRRLLTLLLILSQAWFGLVDVPDFLRDLPCPANRSPGSITTSCFRDSSVMTGSLGWRCHTPPGDCSTHRSSHERYDLSVRLRGISGFGRHGVKPAQNWESSLPEGFQADRFRLWTNILPRGNG